MQPTGAVNEIGQSAGDIFTSLSLFFNITSESVIAIDKERISGCSPNFASCLGFEPYEIVNKSLKGFFFKDDLELIIRSFSYYKTEFERIRLIARDGKIKHLFFRKQTIPGTQLDFFIFKEVDNNTSKSSRPGFVNENVNEGFWDWKINENEVIYDEQWYKLLGYNLEEVVHSNTFWEDRIHPEDKANVFSVLNDHLKGITEFYHTEHRLLSKGGKYFWVLDMGKVIERNSQNEALRIIGVTLDISNRIDTEHELKLNEERYRSIYEHLSDGFCRFNFSGLILEANNILASLLKLPPELLVGRYIQEFLPARTVKNLMKQVKIILRANSLVTETELIANNNKKLTVSVSARLITQNKEKIIQALVRDISIMKEFERVLVEEKQKFKLLVENSPEMMLRLSRSLRVLYISPNFKEILPGNLSALIDQTLNQIGLPQNIQLHLEQSVKGIFKRPRSLSISFTFKKNQKDMLFEAILTPERKELNSVDSVLITFRNVTGLKQSNGINRSTLDKLDEAEKIVHFGGFEFKVNSSRFLLSEELLASLDIENNSAVIGIKQIFKHLHPDDKVVLIKEMKKALKKVASLNFTFRIITQSGVEKHLHCLAELSYDPGMKPLRVTGTILDITEKRKIQELLAHEKDSLQIIMDNVPDAIYFKNSNGQYLRVNRAFANLVNYNHPEELIGKTDFDIYPEDKARESYEEDQTVISTGNALVDKQDIMLNQEGSKLWLQTTKVGIRDLTGTISQIVGISRDVTQFIVAREELKLAKEKAEQADNLKSAFLANMSHEIRTPINGILGFANLLEMREFPRDKEKKYLSIINNSGKLLLNLINDIIDIAKIEAGQINIDDVLVDINSVLRELKEFYQTESIRREKFNVEIRLSLSEGHDTCFILIDVTRLKQVLNNLIYNALKFTDKGYIEFGYRKQSNMLLFYVKDTGLGISGNEKEIIFERFKQAGMGSRKKEGTGLGLAISKGLVELMGGRIWVDSEPGKGSTFSFMLPLAQPAMEPAFINSSGNNYTFRTVWEKKRLLLVEDEEANYVYVQELLSESGMDIIHVKTGEEAIDKCRKHPDIDIVLMDIRLPGINGIEALNSIRTFRPNVPVIAQTAFAMENEREFCLHAGCDDYISKPFDQEALFLLLDRYLAKK